MNLILVHVTSYASSVRGTFYFLYQLVTYMTSYSLRLSRTKSTTKQKVAGMLVRRLRPRSFLILILLSLAIVGLVLPRSESAYYDGYTHGVLDEHVTATWCPSCRTDEPNVMKVYNDQAGSFFVVSYRTADEWSNPASDQRIVRYQAIGLPFHVFDGAYLRAKGEIYTTDMRSPAVRPVHKIGLAVRKTVNTSTLEYQGSVQEMDNKPFVGYVQVYITENKLHSEEVEWNFVFRAFGIEQQLNMAPNSFASFSGKWVIPSNVKAENILVVAAVFDNSTAGYYGPYAVQAVDDNRSGEVIPEVQTPIEVATVSLVITSLAIFGKRRLSQGKAAKVE